MAEFHIEVDELDDLTTARIIHDPKACEAVDNAAWWTNSPTYYCPWCGERMTRKNTRLTSYAEEGWGWWWEASEEEHSDG